MAFAEIENKVNYICCLKFRRQKVFVGLSFRRLYFSSVVIFVTCQIFRQFFSDEIFIDKVWYEKKFLDIHAGEKVT